MSQRINVMVSDEVNEKLNDLSKRYGMAKSSMCAFVLGQWLDTMDRTSRAFTDMNKETMVKAIAQGMKDAQQVSKNQKK